MTPKLVRTLVTAVIVTAAALLPFGLRAPASADTCQRSVWIDPMMTVPESAGVLNLTVHTSGCAAAGSVVPRPMPGPTPSPTLNPTPDSPAICGAEPGHVIEPFFAHLVRAGSDPGAMTVRFDTIDGTAVAGVTYTPVHNLISFPPGAASVDVPIDLLPGAAGYFLVQVSEPSVGIVVSPVAQMTVGPLAG